MYLGWVWLAQKNAAEASFQTKALYTLLNWAIVNYTHTRTQALVLVFGFPWNLSPLMVSWWTLLPWKKPSNAVNRDDRLTEGISTEQIYLLWCRVQKSTSNSEERERERDREVTTQNLTCGPSRGAPPPASVTVRMKLVKPWNSFKRALLEKQPIVLNGL